MVVVIEPIAVPVQPVPGPNSENVTDGFIAACDSTLFRSRESFKRALCEVVPEGEPTAMFWIVHAVVTPP